jgi:hypothetical protein
MNEGQPTTEQLIEAPVAEAQQNKAQSSEPQAPDPRRRLRELLAIPDSKRTDALWDEIIGLEIQLAPGNRAPSPQPNGDRAQKPSGRQEPPRWQGTTSGTQPAKRFFKKPKRRLGPQLRHEHART